MTEGSAGVTGGVGRGRFPLGGGNDGIKEAGV